MRDLASAIIEYRMLRSLSSAFWSTHELIDFSIAILDVIWAYGIVMHGLMGSPMAGKTSMHREGSDWELSDHRTPRMAASIRRVADAACSVATLAYPIISPL